MLSRIRNAIAVNIHEIDLPHSKLKEAVARLLAENGYLEKVGASEKEGRKTLVISINAHDQPAKITSLSRLSRPGRRLYVKAGAIPTVRHGRGIVLLSTSAGIMTGEQAKSKNLGGELICEVY